MNQSRGLPEWVNGPVTASHKIGTTQTTAQVKYSLCYGERAYDEDQNKIKSTGLGRLIGLITLVGLMKD